MRCRLFNLICVIALLMFSTCSGSSSSDLEELAVGARSPEFSLPALDGGTLKSSSLKGKVVILNFWATWCHPCLNEIPVLKDLSARSKATVIGIALDQDGAAVVKPFV